MGQPEFVHVSDRDRVHVSERLPSSSGWRADRPGDVMTGGGQPAGPWIGSAGPDQGYALRLASLVRKELLLTPGEHLDDVMAGGVEVAMKRSSLFGRAPVRTDLDVAFTVWGYTVAAPDPELVAFRRAMFAGASHDYAHRREIVDHVPAGTLRMTLAQVRAGMVTGWRALLTVPPTR